MELTVSNNILKNKENRLTCFVLEVGIRETQTEESTIELASQLLLLQNVNILYQTKDFLCFPGFFQKETEKHSHLHPPVGSLYNMLNMCTDLS